MSSVQNELEGVIVLQHNHGDIIVSEILRRNKTPKLARLSRP
jgi:hypothetical protein